MQVERLQELEALGSACKSKVPHRCCNNPEQETADQRQQQKNYPKTQKQGYFVGVAKTA
ncbi:MAG: hypothetical protein U0694_28285 [Anaerolineae bacterium]